MNRYLGSNPTGVAELVSAEQYLHTSFEHDSAFVEGRMIQRPVPTWEHACIQGHRVPSIAGPKCTGSAQTRFAGAFQANRPNSRAMRGLLWLRSFYRQFPGRSFRFLSDE